MSVVATVYLEEKCCQPVSTKKVATFATSATSATQNCYLGEKIQSVSDIFRNSPGYFLYGMVMVVIRTMSASFVERHDGVNRSVMFCFRYNNKIFLLTLILKGKSHEIIENCQRHQFRYFSTAEQ